MDKQITPSNQCINVVNIPLPDTLDINDSGGNNSCSFIDVAKCSTILDKIYTASECLPPRNYDYTSGEPRICGQLHPPLVINEHTHTFGTPNSKFQCF